MRDIDSTISFYEKVLLGTLIDRYVSEAPGVESEVAILEVDGDRIELLAPTNNTTSPLPDSLNKKVKVYIMLHIE